MIRPDISEKQAKIVYLGIGSNLGERTKNIENAKSRLLKNNIQILKSSSYYESLSWPNSAFPKFYNIVLKTKTNLKELDLLDTCKNIEKSLGRIKSPKNAPRVCDIDIIDYNKITAKFNVNLPHPRMHKRAFVLIPLFEIEKRWKHPLTGQDIKDLIFSLPNKDISSIKQI